MTILIQDYIYGYNYILRTLLWRCFAYNIVPWESILKNQMNFKNLHAQGLSGND